MKSYKVYVKGKFVCITSDKLFADFINKGNKPNIFRAILNFLKGGLTWIQQELQWWHLLLF